MLPVLNISKSDNIITYGKWIFVIIFILYDTAKCMTCANRWISFSGYLYNTYWWKLINIMIISFVFYFGKTVYVSQLIRWK